MGGGGGEQHAQWPEATGLCDELARDEESRRYKDIAERLELCKDDDGMWCEPCRRLRAQDSHAHLYQE